MPEREFPKIYCQFLGKTAIDGSKHRAYWIQDATEDLFPEIMEHLTVGFIGDEPTTKYLQCKQDSVSMREFREMWINMLNEKYTIVCLTKDNANQTTLAGFNVLTESKANEKPEIKVEGDTIGKLFKIFDYAEKQRDFHKEFNLKTCMKAMGLYVLPAFRGDGLGEKLLDARELLCRQVGIHATITAFSSIISQKCAAKVGYQDFFTQTYETLGKIDEDMKIPGIEAHSKSIKFMYKLYTNIE